MKALRYHENKQRGSQEFPLDYHFVTKNHPRYVMPYHWHEETEIIHVISGQFSLMLDGVVHVVNADEIVYIASGRLHGGEPQDCVYECVVFDMRLLLKSSVTGRDFFHDVYSRKLDITPNITLRQEKITRCLLPMFDALGEQVEGCDIIALGSLLTFMGQVRRYGAYITQIGPMDKETRNVLKLKQVFELIESRPSDPPSLKEMASTIGMSPNHFITFFQKATHQKPGQYIGLYRIELACYEMLATEKNLTEIALDLGYYDLSSFIRCFKRYKGISPGEYLKNLRQKGG